MITMRTAIVYGKGVYLVVFALGIVRFYLTSISSFGLHGNFKMTFWWSSCFLYFVEYSIIPMTAVQSKRFICNLLIFEGKIILQIIGIIIFIDRTMRIRVYYLPDISQTS